MGPPPDFVAEMDPGRPGLLQASSQPPADLIFISPATGLAFRGPAGRRPRAWDVWGAVVFLWFSRIFGDFPIRIFHSNRFLMCIFDI